MAILFGLGLCLFERLAHRGNCRPQLGRFLLVPSADLVCVAAATPRCFQFFAQFQDNSVEIAGFGKRGKGIVLDWTDRGIH